MQATQPQKRPKKTQKESRKVATKHQQHKRHHNIPHTRDYTGIYDHKYICIDKHQYNDIVCCKDGGIANRIGVCVCQM